MMSTLTSIFGDAKSLMFLLFAIGAIAGVVMMNSLTKVVHMVVAVALTFLSLAGVYILLEAEFVAMIQILVYGGAMTILMIFGIMMTKHDAVESEDAQRSFLPSCSTQFRKHRSSNRLLTLEQTTQKRLAFSCLTCTSFLLRSSPCC
jgi:hypothetical protein